MPDCLHKIILLLVTFTSQINNDKFTLQNCL